MEGKNTIKKKPRNGTEKRRVRAARCLILLFFAVILIAKTSIFATPSTVYNLSKSGYYRVYVKNSLSGEWASYNIKVDITDTAYSDTQYVVNYAASFLMGQNVFDITWSLDNHTYADWFGDRWDNGIYYPAGSRQYIFHNGMTVNKTGYHISTAQPGETQSVIEGRYGENGVRWSIDTNATGHTDMGGHGEKHDLLQLSLDPDIFKVNFDYNGGSGNWSSVNVRYDTSDNNDAANASPTRAGYTFEGWYTAEGTQVYDKNGKCVNGTGYWNNNNWCKDLGVDGSSMTVYAHWTANEYTITYHGNTDTLDPASNVPSALKYTYSEDDTVDLSNKKPSRSGYTFLGWSKDSGASSASYAPGAQIGKEPNNIDLYAIWSKNSYKQTNNFYKEKNGTWVRFGNAVVHTVKYRSYYKNTTDGFTGDTTGYHFWKFATDGWTVLGDKNDKDGYGYYSPNEYTIKYDSNGATSGVMKNGAVKGDTEVSSLKYDVSYKLKTNTYKKTGYHFMGWATSKSGYVIYSDGASVSNLTSKNGATITLYAIWKPNKYTVVYNGNGATSGGVASQTCYYDSEYSYAKNAGPGYKKEDRTSRSLFVGWGTDKSSTGNINTPGTKFKNLTDVDGAVVNLYAIWEPDNNDYTITVNPNGGFVTYKGKQYTSTFTFTGKYGTTFDLDVSQKTTDASKWFNKWTLSNVDALSVLDNPDLTFVGRIQGNGTVTANWTDMINITVKPNGGVVNGHTEDFVIQGKQNDPFILDFSFCDYDLKNVEFTTNGCATTKYAYVKASDYDSSYDYDARTDVYTADSSVFTPNGTATISYAAYNMVKSGTITVNWNIPDKTSIYKITLDDNGGSGGDGAIYEKYGFGFYADESASVEINAVGNIPVREGYTFLGYYSKTNKGKQIIDSNGQIVVPADYFSKNSTIYAIWQENEVPETEYIVEHYIPSINPDNGNESYSKDPTLTEYYMGKEGSTINVEYLAKTDDVFQGYAFSYATNSNGERIESAKVTSGMIIKVYYTGKYYRVTANKSTGIEKTEVSGKVIAVKDGETYYKVGTYVTATATCLRDYEFATWTCTSGGLAASSDRAYKFIMPSSDVILTAYSTADPDIVYSITYDLDGGEDPHNPVLYTKKTPTFTLLNPVKANATFEGWTGTGLSAKSKKVTIKTGSTGNREYKANWSWNVYKITLDNQKADTAGTPEYYEKYSIGNFSTKDLTKEIDKITIPTKEGYDFRGYYDKLSQTGDIDPKQYIDADGNITALNTDFESDTTLYAIWTPSVHKVTLDNQGAQKSGTKLFYCKYDDGFYQDETCHVEQESPIHKPQKDTYIFKGYYTEVNGGGTKYINENGEIDEKLKNITSDMTLYALWENRAYTLTIEIGEGISDVTINGYEPTSKEDNKIVYTIKHGDNIKLTAKIKDGYTFKEWTCTKGGIVGSSDNPYSITMPAKDTVMQVLGKPNAYKLRYNANGGTGDDVIFDVKYNETVQMIENPFTNDSIICKFSGWSLDADDLIPDYREKRYVPVSEMASTLGLENSPGATITLYAIWDEAPTIIASDRYFTIDDAINGKITEDELFNKATVTDREDGNIKPGENTSPNGTTKFEIVGFDPNDFTSLTENTDVDITFKATDSAGNVTTVTITIHVVDTAASIESDYLYIRSMNLKYITRSEEEGGLEADSIWRQPAYYSILYNAVNSVEVDNKEKVEVTFGNRSMEGEIDGTGTHRGTPKQSWSFTRADLDDIRQYVDDHGVGNSKEDDALANFVSQFSHCKK